MTKRTYKAASRDGDARRPASLSASPHRAETDREPYGAAAHTVPEDKDQAIEADRAWGERSTDAEGRFEAEEGWEEDAWLERLRSNPDQCMVINLPLELSERIGKAMQGLELKRTEFVLQALETACQSLELTQARKQGLAEGAAAQLIKDPQTGKFRCFPQDFFSEEDLYGFETIDGKYYQKRWAKTKNGWVQVNSGYFEAIGSQEDAPYIKMEDNCPVGSWEVYPFSFFEHDWKWGIYDNPDIILEVRGRQDNTEGELWLDFYVDGRHVDSLRSAQEVHDKIMEYLG